MTSANILTAVITLIAAFMGASISGYLNRKGKLDIEVKSKHRQSWIDSLRQDIALILSKSNFITNDLRAILEINYKQNPENMNLTFSEFIIDYGKILTASLRVRLYLNLTESNHIKLDSKLSELSNLLKDLVNENLKPNTLIDLEKLRKLKEKIDLVEREITKNSQLIFKEEWEKIKKGK